MPGRATSPESHPPARAAWTPCGADPSQPDSSTPWPGCTDLQQDREASSNLASLPFLWHFHTRCRSEKELWSHSLTSQQVKHADGQRGCQAAAEAGADPGQSSQQHQAEGGQREQKLTPPQVCRHTGEQRSGGGAGLNWRRRRRNTF